MKLPVVLACGLALAASAESQTGSSRVRVLVNASYNLDGLSFSDSSTFTSFVEEGVSTRDYDGGKGFVFEAGAIVGLWRGLGVLGSFEIYESDLEGTYEESLPHPLYFDRLRTVSGSLSGLSYSEKAVHLDAVYTHVFSSATVDLFGGPTFFFTSTEILDTVQTSSSYPFDEAAVTGTTTAKVDDDPIGFNAGGAVTWKLTRILGLSVQARYCQGKIQIARANGSPIELDAGGFRVGGGIRLAF
jgi:hypothetical protein